MIGKLLGPYKILEQLGAGGMGEVYLAEDPRLKRQVALKLLPAQMAADPKMRRRFEREAEAIAALDHPNIVTIHSLEEADGTHFITMQLVEGKTLDEVISADGLPLEQLIKVAVALADALCAAHEAGITHRDLKPTNIMVGEDGRVRILDFGLAKHELPEGIREDSDDLSEARTGALTAAGVMLGTVPYMSPEQVQGRAVDHRSDLFSLGVILYEMAVGQRPFEGETAADLISSILRDTPEAVTDLNRELPEQLGDIIAHCLEKNPDRRFQTAQELRCEVEELRAEGASGTGAVSSSSPRAAATTSSPLPLPDKPSLAVLPFANLSGDPEQEFLALGLTTDIMADLVRISGLFLVSRDSMFTYRDKMVSAREVGQELGVRNVLQGTVRKSGRRVRITAHLIEASSGQHVWGERFDRDLEDLFAVQDEINDEIVTALDVKLLSGEAARVFRKSLRDPAARERYYRATDLLFRWTRADNAEAKQQLSHVIRLEPESPWGYVMLSWAHYFDFVGGWTDSPSVSMDRAMEQAYKALEIGDVTGMAHLMIGQFHLFNGDHDEALIAAERALEERPSCPGAFALHANILNYAGRPAEAVGPAKQAIRLTPRFPAWFPAVLAGAYYLSGRFEEAIDAATESVALAPGNLDVRLILGAALVAAEQQDEAVKAAKDALTIDPNFKIARYSKGQPYKDAAVLEQVTADLRAAGLP